MYEEETKLHKKRNKTTQKIFLTIFFVNALHFAEMEISSTRLCT